MIYPPALHDTFIQTFRRPPTLLTRAPGRVNLMGGHIDYSHGPVFPMAIQQAGYLLAAPTEDSEVSLHAYDLDERVFFSVNDLDGKRDLNGDPLPPWALYPAGVAWALRSAGFPVGGLQGLYSSKVPVGVGLGSSAAFEVACALAWTGFGNQDVEPMVLARLCQQAENGYVGVACGLMDQFASVHGVAGQVLYLDPRTLAWEALPLPPEVTVVIADSGVRRELADSGFNDRRASCERAVAMLKASLPNIQTLRDVPQADFPRHAHQLPPIVRQRAQYVVDEIGRGNAALSALKKGDVQGFGALMFAGHEGARDLFQTSTPDLDTLVEISRQFHGCYGSRITGGGFGGCTVSLVVEDQLESFVEELQETYYQARGFRPPVHHSQPSAGAQMMWI